VFTAVRVAVLRFKELEFMQSGQMTSEQASVDGASEQESRWAGLARTWSKYRPRLFRSVVGIALLFWAANVVRKHVIMAVSLDAVVTTETIDVTAPIDGFVRRAAVKPGSLLDNGAKLASVANPLVDASPHNETKARLSALDGDVQSIEWLIAQLERINQSLAARGVKFQAQRSRQLQLLADELQANVSANQARLREADARMARVEVMTREGVATQQALEEAQRDHAVAKEAQAASAHQLDNARATLDALKDGLSLSDFSTADKSYSGQRQDEVQVALTRLRAEVNTKKTLREALAAQLKTQLAQYERESSASVVTQQRSRVLSVDVGEGVYVTRGTKLGRLSDCSRLRVMVYVNERSYNRLRVGDLATIEVGLDDTAYAGRVELLLGPPELRVNAQAAAGLPSDLRDRYAVVVESAALTHALSMTCDVGQSAKVTFAPSRRFWG
jgi:multidrug resistance efflux pump